MSQSTFAIGIDFGTSTSLVARYQYGMASVLSDPNTRDQYQAPWTPSVVAPWKDDSQNSVPEVFIGWRAWDLLEAPETIREVKRSLGDPDKTFTFFGQTYRPEEVAALILKHIVTNAQAKIGEPIRDVVLSIPANFGGAARQALLAAARIVGLNPLRLINEPTSAALSYTIEHPDSDENLLVFDFGGGTLDITILAKVKKALHVQSTHGNPKLGGIDFDFAVKEWLRGQMDPGVVPNPDLDGILRNEAEQVKWRLSTDATTRVFLRNVGKKDGRDYSLRATITREVFEQISKPLLDATHACLDEAFKKSKISPASIGHVLLVGGTCKIPAVKEMMEARFGTRCLSFDPLTAVAEGASILAADQLGLLGGARALELKDVASHGLGVSYEDPHTRQERYGMLIEPGAELPLSRMRHDLSLKSPTQQTLTITLYEGYAPQDCLLSEARAIRLREETIHDIPVSTTGTRRSLSVVFSYDENAVLSLEAKIEGTTRTLPLLYDARRSARDLEESTARVRQLWSYTGQEEAQDWPPTAPNSASPTSSAPTRPTSTLPGFAPAPPTAPRDGANRTNGTAQGTQPVPPPAPSFATGTAPAPDEIVRTPAETAYLADLDARLDAQIERLKQLKASDLIRSNAARRDMIKQLLATAATARNNQKADAREVKETAMREIEDRSQLLAGVLST